MKRLRTPYGVIVKVTDERAAYLLTQGYTEVEGEKTVKAVKPKRVRKPSTKGAS